MQRGRAYGIKRKKRHNPPKQNLQLIYKSYKASASPAGAFLCSISSRAATAAGGTAFSGCSKSLRPAQENALRTAFLSPCEIDCHQISVRNPSSCLPSSAGAYLLKEVIFHESSFAIHNLFTRIRYTWIHERRKEDNGCLQSEYKTTI